MDHRLYIREMTLTLAEDYSLAPQKMRPGNCSEVIRDVGLGSKVSVDLLRRGRRSSLPLGHMVDQRPRQRLENIEPLWEAIAREMSQLTRVERLG